MENPPVIDGDYFLREIAISVPMVAFISPVFHLRFRYLPNYKGAV